ncbi:hypothetical protein XELAEV_18006014mg [Xenopus laevis]|uniref:CCHC-type domain-containing protein n=1 Tax=Xenopus laevis TaxID=8355 RepID=A0A974I364_XENLA|nr:hypothetical protein XELAEV_18006014mg [Xenopus laevis]
MKKKGALHSSRVLKTRLDSSRRAATSNMADLVKSAVLRKPKLTLATDETLMESKGFACGEVKESLEMDAVLEQGAGVGVSAGSCGAATEATPKVSAAGNGSMESGEQKMATDAEKPGCYIALELAERALRDCRELKHSPMEARNERPVSEGIVGTETVLPDEGEAEVETAVTSNGGTVIQTALQGAGDTGAETIIANKGKAVAETVIEYERIIKSLRDLKCLVGKPISLTKGIDSLIQQPQTQNVPIIMKSESVHPEDIVMWLKRQCTVLSPLVKIYDEEDFWPKLCFKCGSKSHFAGKCTVQKCAFCGEIGHPSKECVNKIRCNLCLREEELGELVRMKEEKRKNTCQKENVSRKEKKKDVAGESQDLEWESIEEEEMMEEGEVVALGPRVQLKREASNRSFINKNQKHKDDLSLDFLTINACCNSWHPEFRTNAKHPGLGSCFHL